MKTKLLDPIAEVRKAREELLTEHAHDLRSLVAALNSAAQNKGPTKDAPVRKARPGGKYWGRTSADHRKAALAQL